MRKLCKAIVRPNPLLNLNSNCKKIPLNSPPPLMFTPLLPFNPLNVCPFTPSPAPLNAPPPSPEQSHLKNPSTLNNPPPPPEQPHHPTEPLNTPTWTTPPPHMNPNPPPPPLEPPLPLPLSTLAWTSPPFANHEPNNMLGGGELVVNGQTLGGNGGGNSPPPT